MCGIAGILKIYEPGEPVPHHLESIPEAWLDILDESIKHRGPDGQGRFRDRATRADGSTVDVAFVHRRLSIIDHEGGHQPMIHDGQRLRPDLTYQPGQEPKLAHELCPDTSLVAVVFNGCIYNHRELRAELEAQGHVFETDHSDTEVLVHGWREWQGESHDQIEGMYTKLIWNRATGQLAWGRDFSGEKPQSSMTLGRTGHVVFCSNLTGLVRMGFHCESDVQLVDPDFVVFDSWIRFGTDQISPTSCMAQTLPRDWSLFPKEPLGHFTTQRARQRVAEHWADLEQRAPGKELDADQLDSLFVRSVQKQVDADVPLGVFLSGGVDSALIAAVARKYHPDMKAFTVRMPHPDYDESQAARNTASSIGIDHTVLDCEADPADDLVKLIEQLGLPFGDSSLLPTFWVCKAARRHVKVALSGDGGDELFGGYRRHTINAVLNRRRRLLKLIPTGLLDQRKPGTRATYLARLATAARYGGYNELLAIFPTPDLRRLIPELDGQPTGDDTFRPVDDPLRHDFTYYLPDDILRKTDTASMAVALEVRAPFLARDLVDAAMRTPLDVLMPNGERKGLLKQVARRHLPDHIVDRPKRGFAIPVGEWFRTDFGGMRQLMLDHLRSADPFPGLGEAGVEINMKFVERMIREHDAAGEKSINPWHGRDHSQRLYMLVVLSIWAKWLERTRREASA